MVDITHSPVKYIEHVAYSLRMKEYLHRENPTVSQDFGMLAATLERSAAWFREQPEFKEMEPARVNVPVSMLYPDGDSSFRPVLYRD